MRAIRKVTSCQVLTKKSIEEKQIWLYTKNTYILKLLLNVVTAGIEALVISGNKFLHACVKEVCYLQAQPQSDTFHKLLIIVEVLWTQLVFQVAQSEIRAVRRVVKQLLLEMLQ
jgi:hypothetical protein